MSFGFSAGDIVAGAGLAYKLYKIFSDSAKTEGEYHETISSLVIVHKVFLQIEQMRATSHFAQATMNAILFAVNSANDRMVTFLAKHEKYGKTFKPEGSGSMMRDVQRKLSWTVHMSAEVDKLRKSLNTTLISISCLLQISPPESPSEISHDIILPGDYTVAPKSTYAEQKYLISQKIYPSRVLDEIADPNFEPQPNPRRFFRPGQVFSIFVGSHLTRISIVNSKDGDSSVEVSSYVGPILIRRFVVIREGYDSCLCLAIRTYAGRGCIGLPDQSQHACLYCGDAPQPLLEGEEDVILNPIKMNVEHPSTILPKESRIFYGEIHEVSHSCKVRSLGLVDVESIETLQSGFESSHPKDKELKTSQAEKKEEDKVDLPTAIQRAKSVLVNEFSEPDQLTLDDLHSSVAGITGLKELKQLI